MPELTMQKRYRLQTADPRDAHIVLVGCGGTGSFLALHLARLAYHARDRYDMDLRLTFIDPDTVEYRNLGRQNFAPAEVGRNKARALAWRYNRAFGLDIHAFPCKFDRRRLRDRWNIWHLIIGAVDNAAARRSIAKADLWSGQHNNWWLDCGNEEHAGQVLLGNRWRKIKAPSISKLGFCDALPMPTVQAPDLLEDPVGSEDPESCAELTLADAQSLMVNQAMATYAAQYVYRMLITRDLDIYATYIDLQTGGARSEPITGEPGGTDA
jgi:PRTRC genetic system ThiF family protein